MKRFLLSILALSVLLFSSCNKPNSPISRTVNNVLIFNQGNFTEQNGSLSLYSEDSLNVTNRAFESVNKFSIGACIQSACFSNNEVLYIACSNPDKIVVCNALSLSFIKSISTKVSSPRNIISYNDKIYVTNYGTEYSVGEDYMYNYYKSYVAIYDANSLSLIDTIAVGTNAEGLLYYGSELYVGTSEGIKVVDLALGVVSKTISDSSLGTAKHFVVTNNGIIYASFPAYGIASINPSTKSIVNKYSMPIDYDGYIAIDSNSKNIYSYCTTYDASWNPTSTLNRFSIDDLQSTKILDGTYFYNIGVSPFTGNIYTTETSFTSNCTMKVFDSEMNLKDEETVGVGTYRYLFYQYSELLSD